LKRIRSVVRGCGSYLPERVVTNHDLVAQVETSHEWIVQRTGIEQRYIAADHETTSYLGIRAAQAALKDPAAAVTYRRALNQARAGSDPAGEAQAALGLGQMLINQGARVEGSQMLHEASAAARRSGARGVSLARRVDDLLAGIGPLEPSRPATATGSHRREAAAQREPRVETPPEVTEAEPPPADSASESSSDAVFRETTLPPL